LSSGEATDLANLYRLLLQQEIIDSLGADDQLEDVNGLIAVPCIEIYSECRRFVHHQIKQVIGGLDLFVVGYLDAEIGRVMRQCEVQGLTGAIVRTQLCGDLAPCGAVFCDIECDFVTRVSVLITAIADLDELKRHRVRVHPRGRVPQCHGAFPGGDLFHDREQVFCRGIREAFRPLNQTVGIPLGQQKAPVPR